MSWGYCVYGLRVLSDGPIPGLLPSDGTDTIDIRVWLNRMPSWWEEHSKETETVWYTSPAVDGRGQPRLIVWKLNASWYRLLYFDGTEFLVDPTGGELWSRWPTAATLRDTATYLIGPVMGFILRIRGVCCLHASAASTGQTIIAFAGPPHAGKSTTAAAFAKLGYPVVSDDILALQQEEDGVLVRPGYPRICLWPDATTSLYGASHHLPRITPEEGINDWWDKRYLDLTSSDGHWFQTQSLPLSAI